MKKYSDNSCFKNQAGQVLVDFSIAALVVMGLFGAIVDAGLYFYRESILSQVLNTVSREMVSNNSFASQSCDSIEQSAVNLSRNLLNLKFGIKSKENQTSGFSRIKFGDSQIAAPSTYGNPSLILIANWETSCLMCSFFGVNEVSSKVDVVLEYPCNFGGSDE